MKMIDKATTQENSLKITKSIPLKSANDLPPYEVMVSQLVTKGAMTEEDIQALDYLDVFD